MTTDPRIVSNAKTIPQLSFIEVGELAYFGAKVLHPRAIRPARQADIPVRMLNTFEPDNPGTLINGDLTQNGHAVKAITAIKNLSILTVAGTGMMGIPGVAEIPKLISLSLRIGVGQSVSVLKKQKGLVRRMLSARPYQPDELLAGLLPHLDDPLLDIPGFHLFSFNNVEKTERWRQRAIGRLPGNGRLLEAVEQGRKRNAE